MLMSLFTCLEHGEVAGSPTETACSTNFPTSIVLLDKYPVRVRIKEICSVRQNLLRYNIFHNKALFTTSVPSGDSKDLEFCALAVIPEHVQQSGGSFSSKYGT